MWVAFWWLRFENWFDRSVNRWSVMFRVMVGWCRFGSCWPRRTSEWRRRRDPALDLRPTSWPTCRASERVQRVHGWSADGRRWSATGAQVWWTRQVTEPDVDTLEPTLRGMHSVGSAWDVPDPVLCNPAGIGFCQTSDKRTRTGAGTG